MSRRSWERVDKENKIRRSVKAPHQIDYPDDHLRLVRVSTNPEKKALQHKADSPIPNAVTSEDRLHAHLQKAHGVLVIKRSKRLRKILHSFPGPGAASRLLATSLSRHLRKAQSAPTQTPPVVVVKKKLSPHRRKAHPATACLPRGPR